LANTNIAKKVDPIRVLNYQSFLLWNFAIWQTQILFWAEKQEED